MFFSALHHLFKNNPILTTKISLITCIKKTKPILEARRWFVRHSLVDPIRILIELKLDAKL